MTANVAKGVSVNVPLSKAAPRGKVAATGAPRAATAVPTGPRMFRRPFGRMPGWLYWMLGITAAVLPGAIPFAGTFLLLIVVCGLIAVWLMTPKQIEGQSVVSVEASESN